MGFTQDTTGSPVTADGTWQTLITGDNSGSSAPAHYSLSIFPETFYQGDRLRVLVETFDENDSTWHYYLGKELGYSDLKYPTRFIDGNDSFITAGIVARWRGNSSLTDSVGNEDLTDNGSIAYDTADKKEGSASFDLDGSTDYLTTTNDEPFDFEYNGNGFTISGWIKTPSVATNEILWAKGNNLASAAAEGYYVYLDTSGNIVFRLTDTSLNDFSITSATALSTNQWYYVTVTYDGSSDRSGMKIYINSILDQTGTASAISTSILNAQSFSIGAESDGGAKFTGNIDDVVVYDYDLSASQIAENFNSYLGLITHINFDNQVEDQFGSNDGTWTGTELYGVGKIDRSGIFDGSSYVTLANESNFDFDFSNPFSASLWFKGTNTGNNEMMIDKLNSSTVTGWEIFNNVTNRLRLQFANSNPNRIFVEYQSNLRDGNWHHALITYDGSSAASGVTFYVDGVNVSLSTITDAASGSALNNDSLTLGARPDASLKFTGEMDEVKIWDKELTSEEAEREYGTKLGEIFNVFLPKQKFRVKIQQYQGHFRNYDFILYEVA